MVMPCYNRNPEENIMSQEESDMFDEYGLPRYFDMQAELAHTKHVGGLEGTQAMLELCGMGPDKYPLNVGCGAASTNIYIAKTYGVKSVGVDIKPNMVESARKRVERHGVADLIELRTASAMDLPFLDDTFDIVISESVNVFIPDRAKAATEYVRVTKPGGYVGINEAILTQEPSPQMADMLDDIIGYEILPPEYWIGLLEDAGLTGVTSASGNISTREEAKSQMGFMGKGDMWYVLKGTIKFLFKDTYTRGLVKQVGGANPKEIAGLLGYGVFVGQKKG
jgi:ubiquinone/menaquinone biosynthesis C-methylase UbiE